MEKKGKERLMQELKGFVSEKLEVIWGNSGLKRLTNHKICHGMFQKAFEGHSNMHIQMKDLWYDGQDTWGPESEDEVLMVSCSLVTQEMLDYDNMMFKAMNDLEDEEYREAAREFYRPYLFGYVAEIRRDQYDKLLKLQERIRAVEKNETSPYLILRCCFAPQAGVSQIELSGYVIRSASPIMKKVKNLYIIEDPTVSRKKKKELIDTYELSASCQKDDRTFIDAISKHLPDDGLSTINAYKVGNGNCIYAQGAGCSGGFFYDIGFHYRHRPKMIAAGGCYSYRDTMKEIYSQDPAFFILSHWDMDHIAGSFGAHKDFLDCDWFAPDCADASLDARRLARYLDMKDHLFLAKRPEKGTASSGRMIGQVDKKRAAISYTFYMGGRVPCDSSASNCEGIVIKYTARRKRKRETTLMMGDVNYASFDLAQVASGASLFARTQIDYLIAPHHGSEHTDYQKIVDDASPQGTKVIICCTGKEKRRPDAEHKEKLKARFGDVRITEEATLLTDYSIKMRL